MTPRPVASPISAAGEAHCTSPQPGSMIGVQQQPDVRDGVHVERPVDDDVLAPVHGDGTSHGRRLRWR